MYSLTGLYRNTLLKVFVRRTIRLRVIRLPGALDSILPTVILFHIVISRALVIRIAGVRILRVIVRRVGIVVGFLLPAVMVLRLILIVLPCEGVLAILIVVVVILDALRMVIIIAGRFMFGLLLRSLRGPWS